MRLLGFITMIATAAPCLAQDGPIRTFGPSMVQVSPEYRSLQRNALAAQRRLLLKMADSMPEQVYRDRATPAQRDFAEQVLHVMSTSVSVIVAYGALPEAVPAPPDADTATVLNTRAGMRSFILGTYEWLVLALDYQDVDNRNIMLELVGGRRMPRWQVWDELNQHAWWTMGQVVANFRKNGMAPPSFQFF